MSNDNHYSNLAPDPFLPFLNNYEEQFQSIEQDPWTNAQFGFNGFQDLSFLNPTAFEAMSCLQPGLSDPSQFLYLDQGVETNLAPQEKAISEAPQPKRKNDDSTSTSQSPAPTTKNKKPKRAVSSTSDTVEPEGEESILEKRRRNTIASARFRIKKKEREAELERKANENAEKAEALEKKVAELENQVKWLRSLLLEKASS